MIRASDFVNSIGGNGGFNLSGIWDWDGNLHKKCATVYGGESVRSNYGGFLRSSIIKY